MIYNLKDNNLICSTDGFIENIQETIDRWGLIDYYHILIEAGELFYDGKKYEISEPSVVFKSYRFEKDKEPEIFIIPCKDALKRLLEIREIRENRDKKESICAGCCSDCTECSKIG